MCLDVMRKHYSRSTKDYTIQQENGGALYFAFEKYTLGKYNFLRCLSIQLVYDEIFQIINTEKVVCNENQCG